MSDEQERRKQREHWRAVAEALGLPDDSPPEEEETPAPEPVREQTAPAPVREEVEEWSRPAAPSWTEREEEPAPEQVPEADDEGVTVVELGAEDVVVELDEIDSVAPPGETEEGDREQGARRGRRRGRRGKRGGRGGRDRREEPTTSAPPGPRLPQDRSGTPRAAADVDAPREGGSRRRDDRSRRDQGGKDSGRGRRSHDRDRRPEPRSAAPVPRYPNEDQESIDAATGQSELFTGEEASLHDMAEAVLSDFPDREQGLDEVELPEHHGDGDRAEADVDDEDNGAVEDRDADSEYDFMDEEDPYADWNIPSWQELIASLYRPER